MNDQQLDNLFRERLGEFEHTNYNPQSWQALSARLLRTSDSRRVGWWWIPLLGLLAVIVCSNLYWWNQLQDQQQQILELKSQQNQSVPAPSHRVDTLYIVRTEPGSIGSSRLPQLFSASLPLAYPSTDFSYSLPLLLQSAQKQETQANPLSNRSAKHEAQGTELPTKHPTHPTVISTSQPETSEENGPISESSITGQEVELGDQQQTPDLSRDSLEDTTTKTHQSSPSRELNPIPHHFYSGAQVAMGMAQFQGAEASASPSIGIIGGIQLGEHWWGQLGIEYAYLQYKRKNLKSLTIADLRQYPEWPSEDLDLDRAEIKMNANLFQFPISVGYQIPVWNDNQVYVQAGWIARYWLSQRFRYEELESDDDGEKEYAQTRNPGFQPGSLYLGSGLQLPLSQRVQSRAGLYFQSDLMPQATESITHWQVGLQAIFLLYR